MAEDPGTGKGEVRLRDVEEGDLPIFFEKSGKREVSYWIGRRFWGRGVATRAASRFLDHVKDRPLYAVVAKPNVASIRVLEKCGFLLSDEEIGPRFEGSDEVEEVLLKLEA